MRGAVVSAPVISALLTLEHLCAAVMLDPSGVDALRMATEWQNSPQRLEAQSIAAKQAQVAIAGKVMS